MAQKRTTWALYLGTEKVAEGLAESRAACTVPAFNAAYAHAETSGVDVKFLGSIAIDGYRLSIWGPRGGNLEHMTRL